MFRVALDWWQEISLVLLFWRRPRVLCVALGVVLTWERGQLSQRLLDLQEGIQFWWEDQWGL
jgi:hypothetical protein